MQSCLIDIPLPAIAHNLSSFPFHREEITQARIRECQMPVSHYQRTIGALIRNVNCECVRLFLLDGGAI